MPRITAELVRRVETRRLRRSGLLDGDWYLTLYPDVLDAGEDPVRHFCASGWKEGRLPNPYFDPDFYRAQVPPKAPSVGNPLLHYFRRGERRGLKPIAHFDPAWYRARYRLPRRTCALAHYLRHASSGTVSPLPEFDVDFYLAQNPDVRAAGIDPFLHYLHTGYREGRNPSATFDSRLYIARRLHGSDRQNPLIHSLGHRADAPLGAAGRPTISFSIPTMPH